MKIASEHGMLDPETLKQMVVDNQIETVLTAFPDIYGRLLGKRVTGNFFVSEVMGGSIRACDYLLACDMEMDTVPGYAFTSWSDGYGDIRLIHLFLHQVHKCCHPNFPHELLHLSHKGRTLSPNQFYTST